jgi:tRNA A-37 threonylcarbamoyl transferase component Bud32
METSSHTPSPEKMERILGDYTIESELGRGGMGVVYLARQRKLNRRVAVKMLTGHYGPEELTRFLAEAETAAGLHHTNIAQIYEVGEHEGAPFYSMEYVEGGSLGDKLREARLSLRDAVQLLIQVARALHFAHQNGVVHRDMKPANVLIDPEGVPKVADFGIAKRLKEDTKLTLSGVIIGTPTYMAPEQAKGTSRHVGPAADVYSLGAILYEVLAGRPPFLPEDSETAITVRVLTEDPVSPAWHHPQTPRDLETICLKCLEKEPRDRYGSAAAFAEDLRRFLDDETILAKPPTAAVKMLKWTRRHPWRFVSAAAAALLLTAAAVRLFHWEFHERPHREYAMGMDYRFGGPELVGKMSAASVGKRAVSLRFTRRGLWGPIVRVEAINARQFPSNNSQFFGYDPLPNWIEGGFGGGGAPKKTREATTIDFNYENGSATEAIARDCNGMLTWHLIYDRSSTTSRIHARFVTSRGFDFASRGGASLVEFERDAAGRDIKATFFSGSGQPAANSEGVYGYALQRDAAGQIVGTINLDKDAKPAPNSAGQIAFRFQNGANGLVRKTEFCNGEGKPAPSGNISALATDYDSAGNDTRLTCLDANGHPTNNANTGWAVQEIDRNERGEITEQRFKSADSTGALKLVSKKDFAYDEHGYPVDIRFAGQTKWRTALKFDDRGNVLEERILGPAGQLIPGPEGWSIHRHAWQFSPDGSREEETWFDSQDRPAYVKGGEHRRISEFDAAGNMHRYLTDQIDPARFSYQRYVCEPEYDAQGRMRHNIVRYEDASGQPAVKAGLGFTTRDITLDENEREILEWKLGCNVAELGAPVFRTETEWQRSGARKRVVRQACDENRKPLAVVSNGTPAYFEQDFNELDGLERIYETGFDEKVVGFSSREAKFVSGHLQSVTHSRSDGTLLDNVRVIIKSVAPAQPKAAQLRAEDQLVTANDKPVTSAYAWVAAGTFPGGWVEVIRDGRRLRIDGFQEGPLGIVLEDRAPATPR